MEPLSVSVIIPSYNGAHKVLHLLRSLEQQTYTDFETLVLIDGSTDNTQEIIDGAPLQLQQLRTVYGENLGRAGVRNKGAREASGNLLLFLDDDLIAEPALVEQHVSFHSNNENAILCGAAYRNPVTAPTLFGQYLADIELQWRAASRTGFSSLENYAFTAAQSSVPKTLFHQLNGFDERLQDAEDFDFGVRALQASIPVMYNNTIISWHADWPALPDYLRRHRQYRMATKRLLQLHPDYAELFPHLYAPAAGGVKQHVSRASSRLLFRWAVSENVFFKALPRRVQFLLFRLIISGHPHTVAPLD